MQESKTLTLPVSKKTVIIKGYMSRAVDKEVQRILLGKNKTHYETDVQATDDDSAPVKPRTTKVLMDSDPTVKIDADDKLLELMVISIAGVAVTPAAIEALPSDDVDYILAQINGVENDSKVVAGDPKVPPS